MPNPGRSILDETARAVTQASHEGARQAEGLVDAAGETLRSSAGSAEAAMRRMADGAQRSPAEAMSALSDVNRVLMEGAQEMAREWSELVQSGYKRGAERMSQAMTGGSPADLAMLQPTLAREAMENWIAATTRLTDISFRVADRATRAWSSRAARPATEPQGRGPRPLA